MALFRFQVDPEVSAAGSAMELRKVVKKCALSNKMPLYQRALIPLFFVVPIRE